VHEVWCVINGCSRNSSIIYLSCFKSYFERRVLTSTWYCTRLAVLASDDQSLPVRKSIVQELNITGAVRTLLTYPTPLWLCREDSRTSEWRRLSLMTKKFIVPVESPELLHADVEAAAILTADSWRYPEHDAQTDGETEALLDNSYTVHTTGLIGDFKEIPGQYVGVTCTAC